LVNLQDDKVVAVQKIEEISSGGVK
jgi:hypothetical protein